MNKANNIKYLLAFLVVAAAISLVVTIVVRTKGGKPAHLPARLPIKVDVSLNGIHYSEIRKGVKQWDLSADRADYNRESNKTSLVKVKLLIAAPGAGEFKVTADRADYDNASKDVLLVGHVQGEGGKGMRFSTENLKYVAALSQLETSGRVHFQDQGLVVEGVGMTFHTQTRRLQLMGDVRADVRSGAHR